MINEYSAPPKIVPKNDIESSMHIPRIIHRRTNAIIKAFIQINTALSTCTSCSSKKERYAKCNLKQDYA